MAEEINLDELEQTCDNHESEASSEYLPSDIRDKYMEHAFIEYVHHMIQRFRQRELENEVAENARAAAEAAEREQQATTTANDSSENNTTMEDGGQNSQNVGENETIEEQDNYEENATNDDDEMQDSEEISEAFDVEHRPM